MAADEAMPASGKVTGTSGAVAASAVVATPLFRRQTAQNRGVSRVVELYESDAVANYYAQQQHALVEANALITKRAGSPGTQFDACIDATPITKQVTDLASAKPGDVVKVTDLASAKPGDVVVKNTFITIVPERSPSLDGFLQERTVKSCPETSARSLSNSSSDEALIKPINFVLEKPEVHQAKEQLQDTQYIDDAKGANEDSGWLPTDRMGWFSSAMDPNNEESMVARAWATVAGASEALGLMKVGYGVGLPAFQGCKVEKKDIDADEFLPFETSTVGSVRETSSLEKLRSPEVPSIGSVNHLNGNCKPCAFSASSECTKGADCKFCHLCEVGEKQRRRKAARRRAHYLRRVKKDRQCEGHPTDDLNKGQQAYEKFSAEQELWDDQDPQEEAQEDQEAQEHHKPQDDVLEKETEIFDDGAASI
eukprot:TRINITY_DN2962_c0_g1_i4.p1 TRINITY_DN2962_c0_g1~~TRINITY_DN2962_c0_g1_i4.p1  ORF type:complete len:448 (-),score=92.14 TRINITY_DN2962_c0_g1_i4:262-1533(-)